MRKIVFIFLVSMALLAGAVVYQNLRPQKYQHYYATRDETLHDLLMALREKDVEKARQVCYPEGFKALDSKGGFEDTSLWELLKLQDRKINTSWDIWALWAERIDVGSPKQWEPYSWTKAYSPKLGRDVVLVFLKGKNGWRLAEVILSLVR